MNDTDSNAIPFHAKVNGPHGYVSIHGVLIKINTKMLLNETFKIFIHIERHLNAVKHDLTHLKSSKLLL